MGIRERERIDYELCFIRPFKSVQQTYVELKKVSETQIMVTWGCSGKMNYPMNLMLLFMNVEEMIGRDCEQGLSLLKQTLKQETEK